MIEHANRIQQHNEYKLSNSLRKKHAFSGKDTLHNLFHLGHSLGFLGFEGKVGQEISRLKQQS